jgi:hypothetical protein
VMLHGLISPPWGQRGGDVDQDISSIDTTTSAAQQGPMTRARA